MSKKKERFESLLRENGTSEYWCDKIFNPNDDFPNSGVMLCKAKVRYGLVSFSFVWYW